MTTTAAAAGTRRHTGTYPAELRQVGLTRSALAEWLGGCPQANEVILVASEFATNSVVHSVSRDVGAFTVRAEVGRDRLRIEVEDGGGPWRDGAARRRAAARIRCRDGDRRAGELGDRRGRLRAHRLGQARLVRYA